MLEMLCIQKQVKYSESKIITSKKNYYRIALQFDCQRTATAIALEQTTLAVVNINSFKKVIRYGINDRIIEVIECFQASDLFKGLSEHSLAMLATKTIERQCSMDTRIITEGETPQWIYFIVSGTVRIAYYHQSTGKPLREYESFNEQPYDYIPVQKHNYSGVLQSLEQREIKQQQPFARVLYSEPVELTEINFDQIGKGQCFCHFEALTRQQVQYSVIAESQLKLLILSQFDINQCLTEKQYEALVSQSKAFPNAQMINGARKEQEEFTKYKKQLFQFFDQQKDIKKAQKQPTHFRTQLPKFIQQPQILKSPSPNISIQKYKNTQSLDKFQYPIRKQIKPLVLNPLKSLQQNNSQISLRTNRKFTFKSIIKNRSISPTELDDLGKKKQKLRVRIQEKFNQYYF